MGLIVEDFAKLIWAVVAIPLVIIGLKWSVDWSSSTQRYLLVGFR